MPLIDKITMRLPAHCYFHEEQKKDLIVLHFTAGPTARGAYQHWALQKNRVATAYLEMLLRVTEPGAALLTMAVQYEDGSGQVWRVFVCDTDMEYVLLHFGERIESAPVVVPPLMPEKPGNPQEPAETPIPEPSMWLLVLGGLSAFLIYFRLRWPPAPLCR